jgi:ferredoxin
MIVVQVGTERVEVPEESLLQRVCDEHQLPVLFGCRNGRCGSCLVQVLSGGSNLRPPTAREARILDVLESESDWRLACQCVVAGDIHVRHV